MISILICEDQTLVRQGLVSILGMEPGIRIVGEATDGETAIEKVAELQPDIVLMDVRMPVKDGVKATEEICSRYPGTRVIILSTYDSEEYVFDGIKAGAMAYVLKDTPADDLVQTIRRVHEGEHFIQPAIANKLLFEFARLKPSPKKRSEYETLSEKEVAIINRLAQGMTSREVAADLALAEGTVRNYTSNILAKLHAGNRVQAINLARQHRII
jgi:two-component system, NarL family, response regulator DegU